MAHEKQERAKENLAQKLAQTEKDLQLALKQEQQAHEEDIDRLSKEKVLRHGYCFTVFCSTLILKCSM